MSHRIIIDIDHDDDKKDIHYTLDEFLEAGGKLPGGKEEDVEPPNYNVY